MRSCRARRRPDGAWRCRGRVRSLSAVMPGLVPGIHVLLAASENKTWMAGTSPAMTAGLVHRPQSRRRQLQQVPVGIAEIDAAAAARPVGRAFDRNAALCKMPLPFGKLRLADRKRHMQRARAIVSRNSAARD